MRFYCPNCRKSCRLKEMQGHLCPACQDLWADGWESQVQSITLGESSFTCLSLRAYEGICRQLIIRAKAGRSLGSANYLAETVCQSPTATSLVDQADLIVYPAQSLWSHWHGSINLAELISFRLAQKTRTKVVRAPLPLHFRLRKQSFQGDRRNKAAKSGALPVIFRQFQRLTACRTVVVDDVVTSGFTMASVARYHPNSEISGLTLARAS